MSRRRLCSATAAMLVFLLLAGGCKEKKAEEQAQPKSSSVKVLAPSGGEAPCVIQTGTAEFEISSNGSLESFLLKDGKRLSIDSTAGNDTSADMLQVHGKAVDDFKLAGSQQVVDANGKLGPVGKRVEFTS